MTVPVEILQLQEFLWNHVQDTIRREHLVSEVTSILGEIARGVWPPIFVGVLLIPLAAIFYQPRVPRGALWIPAFGLFGGTPKFYTHTRPASFVGILLKSRHQVATRRRRKS